MPENKSKIAFNKFVRKSSLLAAILLIISFALQSLEIDAAYSPSRPWLIIFFLVITNLVFYYQTKTSTAKGAQSVNIFIFTTGFKLLFFLMTIVIYALIFRNDAVHFIINFFILYMIFTILEVIQINSFMKSVKGKK